MSKDHGFNFRWGIPELDDQGYIEIPGFIKRNYAKLGIKPVDMMCIGHLSSYKYNSPQGEAQPSLKTIAAEMGYTKDAQVRKMVKRMEEVLGVLTVERVPGKPSTYNFMKLAANCLALEKGESIPYPAPSPEKGTPQTEETSTPQMRGTVPPKRGDEELEESQKIKDSADAIAPQDSPLVPSAGDRIELGDAVVTVVNLANDHVNVRYDDGGVATVSIFECGRRVATAPQAATKLTKAEHNAYMDVISEIYDTPPGPWTGTIKSQFMGTAKKGERKKHNIDPPATPDEISQFAEWWQGQFPNAEVPSKADTLQRRFMQFRASRSDTTAGPDKIYWSGQSRADLVQLLEQDTSQEQRPA